ncbi:cadmium-translocating P-type ATPase [Atopobacter sp. AH10]|nr:cadmium-translocating P-type ATPase [Atopobacter sp. AH10]
MEESKKVKWGLGALNALRQHVLAGHNHEEKFENHYKGSRAEASAVCCHEAYLAGRTAKNHSCDSAHDHQRGELDGAQVHKYERIGHAHDHAYDHEGHSNDHAHDHAHDHQHGKMPLVMYAVGLSLALLGWLMPHTALSNIFFVVGAIVAGYHVAVIEGVEDTIAQSKARGKFTPNSHILMGLAAIGAVLIGSYWEATLLMLIFSGAHFLEEYAEGKSKREISRLMEMTPTTARKIETDGTIREVEVSELRLGDRVKVLNGDQIPIDGLILTGRTSVDESAISGESIPREKVPGDAVYASTINGKGSLTVEVTKESSETTFAKILQLVEKNKNHQTKTATLIQRYEPVYVKAVLLAIGIFMLVCPLVMHCSYTYSIYRGLVLLVAASPCALAAATVSVTLSASSNLAREGVLSKGSSYLSHLSEIKAIACDKTGTLTKGKPEVTNAYFMKGQKQQDLIDVLVALEKESNHPLAEAMVNYFEASEKLLIPVENQIGQGLLGHYKGSVYRIGKASSFQQVPEEINRLKDEWSKEGKTVVYFAKNEAVIGAIALMDLPNQHAKSAIHYFKEQGIHTTLITGDAALTAEAIAKELGVDEVKADVLPEDKSKLVEDLQKSYGKVAMVGDGVNDAPALVKADVGIAMGDGTDAAIEVSDLVIMQNNLSKLVSAHRVAKRMKKVILQNVLFALGVVAFLITVSLLGKADMTISVIVHEGSTLVVILNGLRLLARK